MKKVGVALLGLGTVGGGTYRILTEKKEYFKQTQHLDITIENILEINRERAVALGASESILAGSMAEIASNPNVDIVAEFIGGVEPAKTFILTALKGGKSVVTANKELFCKCWDELEETARKHNAGLYFEASCVGGVPIIRTLVEGMQANEIDTLIGIINGTTNYILTNMCDSGKTYESALKEAQQKGYAEANPSADVDGFDSSYKLGILSSLAFHKRVTFDDIYREGISSISPVDIAVGKELGYTIKLLAIAKKREKGIEVRVHPAFINISHPLASVKDSFNAVLLDGDNVGEIMLYGRGAGARPTGSAIVSDIIYAANQAYPRYFDFLTDKKPVKFVADFESEYYLRCTVTDRPGVLAKVAGVFSKNGVSLSDVMQRETGSGSDEATIIFITHRTKEKSMQKSISQIEELDDVVRVDALIRVEKQGE